MSEVTTRKIESPCPSPDLTKLQFTFWWRGCPDPLVPEYKATWIMEYRGKKYGSGIESREMGPEFILAALDAMYEEAMMCLNMLNEPLLRGDE